METTNENTPTHLQPFGRRLRVVDGLLAAEFARVLAAEGVEPRDWMLLNAVAGTVEAPTTAERLARRSGRVRRLAERGWIVETDGEWTLTEEGTATLDRLTGLIDGIRERVTATVSPEDLATTLATLDAVAAELGGEEALRGAFASPGFGPFGRGAFGQRGAGGHGFGPERFGRPGFGPRGFDRAHAFAAHADEGHRPGVGEGASFDRRGAHGRGGRRAEHAFERGFAAGFERGQASGAA